MDKVVFIAKTNLNTDGRILNQLRLLKNNFGNKLDIYFILFPDKRTKNDLNNLCTIIEINNLFRHNKMFRIFTVLFFTIKSLFVLFRLKPTLIHCQDIAVVIPVYFYKIFRRNKVKIIYDDHEMPNENENIQYKIMTFFEHKLMRISDLVLFANEERMLIYKNKINFLKVDYFLNLPYFDELIINNEHKYSSHITDILTIKQKAVKVIMHQGSLEVERGRKKLADFSRILPCNIIILIVGVSSEDFETFLMEYNLDRSKFYFVGTVDYSALANFWCLVDACIIMYLPTYINNRLCAPNRLYIALKNNIPVIINRDNPVLFNYLSKYRFGEVIEEINYKENFEELFNINYSKDILNNLMDKEMDKFSKLYMEIL